MTILSDSQLQTVALIRRRRQAGLLPTVEEIDFVLDLLDQLLTPGHTCGDRENLSCDACDRVERDGGAA